MYWRTLERARPPGGGEEVTGLVLGKITSGRRRGRMHAHNYKYL